MFKSLLGLAALVLALGLAAPVLADDPAADLFKAYRAGQPLDPPSQSVKSLDEDKAYQIQWDYVGKLVDSGQEVAGFKAGLTSPLAQKKFSAPGPIRGVLLKAMAFRQGQVSSKGYTRMMLEQEIGYILGADIKEKLDPAGAKQAVAQVVPVIELPDLALKSLKGITWQDLVALNACSRGYVLGKPVPPDQVDPNQVTGQLLFEGKALSPPLPGRAALGDQWQALAWTINSALNQGYALKKGMLIITGSLGKMHPGKPGSYRAVYSGGLDAIEFTIK